MLRLGRIDVAGASSSEKHAVPEPPRRSERAFSGIRVTSFRRHDAMNEIGAAAAGDASPIAREQ
jgi:hypothetical protein